ncbi:polysialyltransferase family glycosyltransferase [Bacterioplanoides sp.]|uniref:polysialyltransferase family glycosyltransferase n=1 Tax=Bacterioplanoides sp. TaxID=2066072 RepID=UPI003AFFD62D
MSANSIYFVSTVLHLYVASTIALQRKDENAHLVIIDQPESSGFPVMEAYNNWQSSPFITTRQYFGRYKKHAEKLKARRETFQKLQRLIQELQPGHMFVGNDRRIEFQYSMAQCQKQGINCIGHYMDEGVFTYTGRKASSQLSDKYIDNAIKKLTYGLWWKNPPTIGGSEWISEVHVAFPELIHPLLQSKVVNHLNSEQFQSRELIELSTRILQQCKLDSESVKELNVVLTLPHESIFAANAEYEHQIKDLITELQSKHLRIAAKYHPRNSGEDLLNLRESGVQIIPSAAVLEALLTVLPERTAIIGDMSSTMLITRWLREDMPVYYLSDDNQQLIQILHAIDVRPLNNI